MGVEGGCIKAIGNNPVTSNVATFVIGIVWLLSCLLLCIGYWIYIHTLFHCEYDRNSSLVSSGGRPSPYENQFKCYYVGYTIVLLGWSMINLHDMGFGDSFKAIKLAFGK